MLSDAEKRELIEHEKTIAELLKIRNPSKSERWWSSPHVTSALAAVLTVAVTTVATYYSQSRLKSREYALARQDLRLSQTRDAMVTVYDLLATVLKGTDDRSRIAEGSYDALPDSMLGAIVDETNSIDARWRRERETAEATVYLYFGDSEAIAKWVVARTSMQAYADCAEQLFVAHQGKSAPKDACRREQAAAQSTFAALRDAMIAMYLQKLAA